MSDASPSAHPSTAANGASRQLTADEQRARDLAQQRELEEHQQEQSRGDEERKHITSSILSRVLHFSSSPPPSSDADPAASRVVSVLFLSSTNSIVPHIAAAMTNATHGDHIKAHWSSSSPDSPLVDEPASEAMQEHDVAQQPHTTGHARLTHCEPPSRSLSQLCVDTSSDRRERRPDDAVRLRGRPRWLPRVRGHPRRRVAEHGAHALPRQASLLTHPHPQRGQQAPLLSCSFLLSHLLAVLCSCRAAAAPLLRQPSSSKREGQWMKVSPAAHGCDAPTARNAFHRRVVSTCVLLCVRMRSGSRRCGAPVCGVSAVYERGGCVRQGPARPLGAHSVAAVKHSVAAAV